MFALGVILNECYTRRQPWKESSHFFQIILKVRLCLQSHGAWGEAWLELTHAPPLQAVSGMLTSCGSGKD